MSVTLILKLWFVYSNTSSDGSIPWVSFYFGLWNMILLSNNEHWERAKAIPRLHNNNEQKSVYVSVRQRLEVWEACGEGEQTLIQRVPGTRKPVPPNQSSSQAFISAHQGEATLTWGLGRRLPETVQHPIIVLSNSAEQDFCTRPHMYQKSERLPPAVLVIGNCPKTTEKQKQKIKLLLSYLSYRDCWLPLPTLPAQFNSLIQC